MQEIVNRVAPLMVKADLEHPRKDTGGERLIIITAEDATQTD
jgi:hypothetical protein